MSNNSEITPKVKTSLQLFNERRAARAERARHQEQVDKVRSDRAMEAFKICTSSFIPDANHCYLYPPNKPEVPNFSSPVSIYNNDHYQSLMDEVEISYPSDNDDDSRDGDTDSEDDDVSVDILNDDPKQWRIFR